MSAAEAKTREAEIVAALLWDVPALHRGSRSARDFVAALRGGVDKWWEPRTFAEDTLGHAARAVAYERAGELAKAAARYEGLVHDRDPWTRLLGGMLQAWSETATSDGPIVEALRVAREASVTSDVRARLFAKVATYAFDRGEAELGRIALGDAIALAPEGSRLWSRLALEGLNAGLHYEGPFPGAEDDPPPDDPLVDYPWIHYDSLSGAERALKAEVERRARRAWTWQITFGGASPVADVVAAEVQATWAGALWLRRPIRLQLGGHLLTGAATSPQQWAYGLLMWILGGGTKEKQIYRYAEPNLTTDGIEFVLRALRDAELRRSLRFLAVASEAWDAVSDETLRWVISQVDLVAGNHPAAQEALGLWAAYAARLPEEWFEDFLGRDSEVQTSIVESLWTGAVAHLSQRMRLSVFEVAWSALQQADNADVQLMRIAAATVTEQRRKDLASLLDEKARPDQVARLVDEHAEALRPEALQRAKQALFELVRREQAEAREGKVSFGPGDARLDLARLLAHLDPDPAAVSLLLQIAHDASLPGEHILAARRALTIVRRAGRLPAPELRALHGSSDPVGGFPEHGDLSPELVRAARLQTLAPELTNDEAAEVVAGCRAPETRIRMISLATCAEAVAASRGSATRSAFIWALIGGLFDPDDEAVVAALRGLPDDLSDEQPAAAQVAVARLVPLFEEGSMPVRVAVAERVRRWMEVGTRNEALLPGLHEILDRFPRDKSWLVRTLDGQPRR
ncbi:MAG: hypothetical protein Q8K79_07570 [Solirubrobacteraceae bacterium]|nr:hypothetical protein [Solirubrobacteraceae bacterium]